MKKVFTFHLLNIFLVNSKQVRAFYLLTIAILSLTNANAQIITPPAPPDSGYGSEVYSYSSVIKLNYDDGQTGVMIYIPDMPHADSLPVVIFNHGYGAWNAMGYGGWIDHIVKRGNIVIFPRYQQNQLTSPTVFTTNAVTGFKRAIDTLLAHPSYTQPILSKLCIVGHSYGGVVTANMAEDYANYGIPKPLAFMAAAPGYGTAPSGALSTYRNIDGSIYMLPVFEKDDNIVDSVFALELFDSTAAVPYSHKNLVVHYPDSLGNPPLVSAHGASCSIDSTYDNGDTGPVISLTNSTSTTDAVDFYCYWKLFDALQDCALNGIGCSIAFGNTYGQKYMGTWSNGTPVIPLEIRPAISTGAAPVILNNTIAIYPNPATQFFIVKSSTVNNKLVVTDVNGRIIYISRSNAVETQINTTSFPEGIYFVKAITANSTSIRKLLVAH